MLTGLPAFEGANTITTLAAVITVAPNLKALPRELSSTIATYLHRSLEKEPKQRVHDIADMRLAMTGAFDTPVTLGRTFGNWLAISPNGQTLVFTGSGEQPRQLYRRFLNRLDSSPTGCSRKCR